MPTSTRKATAQKRTTVKDLPAKVKAVSRKEGKRLRGGAGGNTLTINGVAFKGSK